jgi:hypothetical protein
MSDPVVQQSKKNKKKNKNKQSEEQEGGKVATTSKGDLDLFSKFSQLIGQEQNVDFTSFDKHVEEVNAEITSVKTILSDINSGKFEHIPEEEKRGSQ